eukprot:TRINITY_DN578_c0_g2_i1.p1 TRINITY_DN578_c0_g2~~TRINITY_DN578_c0_g2_i1.p1  ORF type:complete len:156 (+),score=14.63 TRINITY_DN578_c0_g2_i1:43-510(+)
MPLISHEIEGERKATWTERTRLWFIHFQFPTVTWNLWGRLITLSATFLLFFGGICALYYTGLHRIAGIYSIILAFVLFPFVWPIKQLKVALIVFQQYFLVGCLELGLAIFCYFSVPTATAGFVLFIAGFCYIIAHFVDEKAYTLSELRNGAWEKL